MKTEKEKVKETAHRDGVKIEFHKDGSRSAVMERRQQMFGICTAIRQQLWDNLDKGAIPVRIVWRLQSENGTKRKKVAVKNDVQTQVPETGKKQSTEKQEEVKSKLPWGRVISLEQGGEGGD